MRAPAAVWIGVVLVLAAGAGRADILGPVEAYAMARAHDPAYHGAQAAREAGRENRTIGRAALLPQISYSYQAARNDSEVSRVGAAGVSLDRRYDSYASVLTIEQALFDYGAWAGYREGRAKSRRAEAEFAGARQALITRVFEAYTQALLAVERQRLAQSERENYGRWLAVNRRLFAAGEGTRTDIVETQARLAQARARAMDAADATDTALHRLGQIVGRRVAADELARLRADFVLPPLRPATFATWRQLAVAHNAELRALGEDVDIAGQQLAQARAAHWPTVSVYARRRRTESNTESTYNTRYDTDSIGIQLELPLFAGGATSARRQQAAATRQQRRYGLIDRRQQVINELRRQFDRAASARPRIDAHRAAVGAARELIHATRQSVIGGERINPDVLDAQQRFYAARRDLLGARMRYLAVWLELHRLAGVLAPRQLERVGDCFAGAPSAGDRTAPPPVAAARAAGEEPTFVIRYQGVLGAMGTEHVMHVNGRPGAGP